MEASKLRSICYFLVFFVGKYGLIQASLENIPSVDLLRYPSFNFNPNSPGSQFINKPLIVANSNGILPELSVTPNFPGSQFPNRPIIVPNTNGALSELSVTPNSLGPQFPNRPHTIPNTNGVLPELSINPNFPGPQFLNRPSLPELTATRPMWPQRENCAILQDIPVISEVTSYQITALPAIPPLPVIQNSFSSLRPIFVPSTSPNLNISPVLYPVQSLPPLIPFPITQTYFPAIEFDEAEIYTILRYEDFFDDFPDFNDQFENNILSNYESNVNEVNIQSTIASSISEVIDTSNTLVSESLQIQELADTNVGIQFPIPYNIEINLPVLTNPVPNFSPPQTPPYFPPPIIIQGSSKSNLKNLLPIILAATILNNDGNTGCGGGCGNRYMPIPYPIPISVNNAVINGPARRNRKCSRSGGYPEDFTVDPIIY